MGGWIAHFRVLAKQMSVYWQPLGVVACITSRADSPRLLPTGGWALNAMHFSPHLTGAMLKMRRMDNGASSDLHL